MWKWWKQNSEHVSDLTVVCSQAAELAIKIREIPRQLTNGCYCGGKHGSFCQFKKSN